MPRWYLIQCKPRQEARAEENLERQGFVCFRPFHAQEKVVKGKRTRVEEPLFPGYIFIRLRVTDDWSPLRSTRGVARRVSFGNKPAVVDECIIECLRQRTAAGPEPQLFTSGQCLRIIDGPFAELEAVFMGMDGDERVVVLLNLLQRQQRLVFPLRSVVAGG